MVRKITLESLAERANLNTRTLQKFEMGQSNVLITTVLRLRHGLGCSWDELLGQPVGFSQPGKLGRSRGPPFICVASETLVAYRFNRDLPEKEIVARLFERLRELGR